MKSLRALIGEYKQRIMSEKEFRMVNSSLRTLVFAIPSIIPDEKDFLEKQIGWQQLMIAPFQTAEIAGNILESYIKSQKPFFLEDLLENARYFTEMNLFEISAYCVRTYAETALKLNCSPHVNFNTKTLGRMYDELNNRGFIKNNYSINDAQIKRINHIVHQDEECKNNPTNKNEIINLIEWAIAFEKQMQSINWNED